MLGNNPSCSLEPEKQNHPSIWFFSLTVHLDDLVLKHPTVQLCYPQHQNGSLSYLQFQNDLPTRFQHIGLYHCDVPATTCRHLSCGSAQHGHLNLHKDESQSIVAEELFAQMYQYQTQTQLLLMTRCQRNLLTLSSPIQYSYLFIVQ